MRMIFAGFAALALTSAAQAQDDAEASILTELGEPYVSASIENGARIFRRKTGVQSACLPAPMYCMICSRRESR